MQATTELLFSYGTLQLESVQLATFGRKLVGAADVLPGFAQTMFKIEDADVVATSSRVGVRRCALRALELMFDGHLKESFHA